MFICLAIYSVCQYYTVLQFKRPTSQRYFEALMESSNVDWKDICYHARPLLTFGTVKSENLKSPLCFVSQQRTLLFIYWMFICAIYIWNQTQAFISGYITISDVTLQSAILGFIDTRTGHFLPIIRYQSINDIYIKLETQKILSFLTFKNNIEDKTLEERTNKQQICPTLANTTLQIFEAFVPVFLIVNLSLNQTLPTFLLYVRQT